ncbi:hypothetical protein [Rhizobium bangladeshense]|uniref:hypothetical protein n=1 Tax=Rhizobium bangladeshense TaxID=1138189 RepID=UPI002180D779|nr:hypothetical protein [Rhizobium bangladeshense]
MIPINEPEEFCRVPRISAAAAGNSKARCRITYQHLIILPNKGGCRHPFSIPEYSAGKAKGACVVSATRSAGFHLPRLAQASYVDRTTFSAEVSKDIVPKIITANGIDAASLRTEFTPGGYILNPMHRFRPRVISMTPQRVDLPAP